LGTRTHVSATLYADSATNCPVSMYSREHEKPTSANAARAFLAPVSVEGRGTYESEDALNPVVSDDDRIAGVLAAIEGEAEVTLRTSLGKCDGGRRMFREGREIGRWAGSGECATPREGLEPSDTADRVSG
jgi:hypothetical protein